MSSTGVYVPTILSNVVDAVPNVSVPSRLHRLGRVEFGLGSLAKLGDALESLSIRQPFIVTGKSLATKTKVIEQVKEASRCGSSSVFTGIEQHAPVATIRAAIGELQATQADGLIAVGGGSPIDAAKLIVHFHQEETGRLLKLVSIPTTLAAAEFTILAGYTDEHGQKKSYRSNEIGSSLVILDGNLGLSTPIRLWLSTGIRALDHCVEQQYRPGASPPVRALAREGAGVLFEALRACRRDERSADARQRALVGAWLSLWSDEGIASLGPSHALGYQLGAPYGIPHGICSCLTLAGTVAIQAQHLPDAEVKQLASLLPFIAPNQPEQAGSPRDQALRVADALRQLIDELELSSTLGEYHVPSADLEGIVERALPDGAKDGRYSAFVQLLRTL